MRRYQSQTLRASLLFVPQLSVETAPITASVDQLRKVPSGFTRYIVWLWSSCNLPRLAILAESLFIYAQ